MRNSGFALLNAVVFASVRPLDRKWLLFHWAEASWENTPDQSRHVPVTSLLPENAQTADVLGQGPRPKFSASPRCNRLGPGLSRKLPITLHNALLASTRGSDSPAVGAYNDAVSAELGGSALA